jgi:hypothetical protein
MHIQQLASHIPPRVAAEKIRKLAQVVAEPMPTSVMATHIEELAKHIELFMSPRVPAYQAVATLHNIAQGLITQQIAPHTAAAHIQSLAEAVHPAGAGVHSEMSTKNKLIVGINLLAKRAAGAKLPPARLSNELHMVAESPVVATEPKIAAAMHKLAAHVAGGSVSPAEAAMQLHQAVIGISTGAIKVKHEHEHEHAAAMHEHAAAMHEIKHATAMHEIQHAAAMQRHEIKRQYVHAQPPPAEALANVFDDPMAAAGNEFYTGMEF